MVNKAGTRCGKKGVCVCVTCAFWSKHCGCAWGFLLLSFILLMELLQIPSITKLYLKCSQMNHPEVCSFYIYIYICIFTPFSISLSILQVLSLHIVEH